MPDTLTERRPPGATEGASLRCVGPHRYDRLHGDREPERKICGQSSVASASVVSEALPIFAAMSPALARIAASMASATSAFWLEEILGVLAALADALAVIGIPGARFLDDAGGGAEIEQFADLGNALAIHDVEFDLLEGRRHLVLDHLDPGLVADHLVAVLDGADAADIEAHRGIEFERIAAASSSRASRTSRRSSCGSG